jgi:predicted dinucleotide-binding enzyme
MKIGIIGSGNMGRSLGILWAEQGHEVFFGARITEKDEAGRVTSARFYADTTPVFISATAQ